VLKKDWPCSCTTKSVSESCQRRLSARYASYASCSESKKAQPGSNVDWSSSNCRSLIDWMNVSLGGRFYGPKSFVKQ
jgi:hypothetical protein